MQTRTFDRAAHCRAIGAHGGATTYRRYGAHHMRAIGTAGYQVTRQRRGVAMVAGILKAKGWNGRRPEQLSLDLAYGRTLAELTDSRSTQA